MPWLASFGKYSELKVESIAISIQAKNSEVLGSKALWGNKAGEVLRCHDHCINTSGNGGNKSAFGCCINTSDQSTVVRNK